MPLATSFVCFVSISIFLTLSPAPSYSFGIHLLCFVSPRLEYTCVYMLSFFSLVFQTSSLISSLLTSCLSPTMSAQFVFFFACSSKMTALSAERRPLRCSFVCEAPASFQTGFDSLKEMIHYTSKISICPGEAAIITGQ